MRLGCEWFPNILLAQKHGKIDPKFSFVAPSNEACFVAIRAAVDSRFDIVDPTRVDCLLHGGRGTSDHVKFLVDGVNFCLRSSSPLRIVAGLVKCESVSLIVGKNSGDGWLCEADMSSGFLNVTWKSADTFGPARVNFYNVRHWNIVGRLRFGGAADRGS